MIISIDGPAGSGKSTVCEALSAKIGFYHLNSGNFYRAICYMACKGGFVNNKEEILKFIKNIDFVVDKKSIIINNLNTEPFLRNKEIEENVANFSSIREVREFVNNELLKFTDKEENLIVEGRDMSSVVFPNADLKFFLTANFETRANRRYNQLYGPSVNESLYESVKKGMKDRDYKDGNKEFGSLSRVESSILIDTSYLTIEEICNIIIKKCKEKV